jgi:hypothetical protein
MKCLMASLFKKSSDSAVLSRYRNKQVVGKPPTIAACVAASDAVFLKIMLLQEIHGVSTRSVGK